MRHGARAVEDTLRKTNGSAITNLLIAPYTPAALSRAAGNS
jgi:hypothetical protein